MKRVFVPVFILFFLLSVKADCYSGFIPKMRLSHSNSKECLYNPLIHINSEDRVAIDYLETVYGEPKDSFTILPRGFYDTVKYSNDPYRIKPFLNGVETSNYWQIISSAGVEYYYSNRAANFIPGSSGKIFQHPSTFVMSQSGNMVLLNSLALYWELREYNYFDNSSNWESFSVDFNRVYAKLKLWKISAMFGKDTLHLGPGEHGMILSANAAPYWMMKFQNEETIRLWGSWNFVIMKGWLKDEREDISNPEIFAMRMTYRPQGSFDFFELGMTRTMMYSGDGMYHYKIVDYPVLISGAKDNLPRGKFDADSYGGIDFTFNIPFYKLVPELKVFKLYFEESGTDIKAIWQVEDLGDFTIPYILFKFYERAYLTGIFIGLENDAMRLEYTKTAFSFYKHHLYPQEGYSYRGMSLGHPLGNNHQALKFNHTHWFENGLSFKWEIGYYQLPGINRNDKDKSFSALFPMFSLDEGLIRRGYFSLWVGWVVNGHILRGYFSLDGGPKSDSDPRPSKITVSDKATVDITLGFSFLLKF